MVIFKGSYSGSFYDFVRNNDCINYTRYFINDKSCIDFYIRFEFLEEDLQKVCKKLNIEYDINKLLKFKSNFRKDKDYRKYYDEELNQIVYDKHKKNLNYLGINFKFMVNNNLFNKFNNINEFFYRS